MATLLGPTFAADITMALSAGEIDRGPEDLGMADIASFCRCRKSEDPTLSLAVVGRSLFTGSVQELRSRQRRAR